MEIIAEHCPTVSVVIDTYNYGRFIEEAIESVLDQTFPSKEIEIIVVDDGSIDDTPERVKKYGADIKYIYKENGGQASAFNVGFEYARGQYVLPLDADDYYAPDRIERVVEEFEKYPEVVLVFNLKTIVNGTRSYVEKNDEFHNLKLSWATIGKFVKCGFSTGNCSFRKKALQQVLPLPAELRFHVDTYLPMLLLWFGSVSSLSKPLYYYRIHGQNLWYDSGERNLELRKSCLEQCIAHMKEKVRLLPGFDAKLLDALTSHCEVSLEEVVVALKAKRHTIVRKDLIHLEANRMKLMWDEWGWWYRCYKVLRFPIFSLFPPRTVLRIRAWYSRHQLYKVRRIFFPD